MTLGRRRVCESILRFAPDTDSAIAGRDGVNHSDRTPDIPLRCWWSAQRSGLRGNDQCSCSLTEERLRLSIANPTNINDASVTRNPLTTEQRNRRVADGTGPGMAARAVGCGLRRSICVFGSHFSLPTRRDLSTSSDCSVNHRMRVK